MPVPPEEQHSSQHDLAYHRARYPSAPIVQQLDEAAAYIVRDLPVKLGSGLKHNFPAASAALPVARWKQVGLAALGLLGANFLIGLEPGAAQSLLGFAGLGLAGYAGWSILQHTRGTRNEEVAAQFAKHTAQLGVETMEERIAALAALDQLAYDHQRYRRPLVHLLAAWLDSRSAAGGDAAGGHDCAVARQMLAEFWQMLASTPSSDDRLPVATVPAVSEASVAAESSGNGQMELTVVESAGSPADLSEPLELPSAEPVAAQPPPDEQAARAEEKRVAAGE